MKATRLALAYQRRYRKDVFVDMVCYRRHGHNELDDPTFTNPLLYQQIQRRKRTVPDAYAERMVDEGERFLHFALMSSDNNDANVLRHPDQGGRPGGRRGAHCLLRGAVEADRHVPAK